MPKTKQNETKGYGRVIVRGKIVGLVIVTVSQIFDRNLKLSLDGKPVNGWTIEGMTEEAYNELLPTTPVITIG